MGDFTLTDIGPGDLVECIDADGYVPYIAAIGGGDYIVIDIDNETGKVVGWVPLTEDELREAAKEM